MHFVSQKIYLEICSACFIIYIQINLCANENIWGKRCHINVHSIMIVVFNKKKIFVFIIFHQSILGNTWRTNFCINWHYEKCL